MSQIETPRESDDLRLSNLLRQARPVAAPPPRFQDAVWSRIEAGDSTAGALNWVEALTVWRLRPRLAVAAAMLLVIAGAAIGVAQGSRSADELAKARYLNSVSPLELRH